MHLRLRHYLRSHRRRNNLTLAEMAKKLGYTLDHYRKFESRGGNHRFTNAIEFIETFAKIEGMNLHEFLTYLIPNEERQHPKLLPWQISLLAAVGKIDTSIRSEICHGLCSKVAAGRSSLKTFNTAMAMLPQLAQLPEGDLAAFKKILDSLAKTKVRDSSWGIASATKAPPTAFDPYSFIFSDARFGWPGGNWSNIVIFSPFFLLLGLLCFLYSPAIVLAAIVSNQRP